MNYSAGNPPSDSAYIANLWEYPNLTVAIFGLQFSSPEGYQMYEEAGIPAEIRQTMSEEPGFLGMREFQEGNGGLLLQYWDTHEALSSFSRRMPHMKWWKWLIEHDGQGLSFYHEIYQCKTAEAVFERGTPPIGPGTFCSTTAIEMGEGRSVERQQRFMEAAGQ